jgi:hypothetical protein
MRFAPAAAVLIVVALAGCAPEPDVPEAEPCTSRQLDFTLQARTLDGADGMRAYDITVTNGSDANCTVQGYPLVEVLSVDGSVIAQAPVPHAIPDVLVVSPGASVYVLVELVAGTVDCDSANTGGLRLTLPVVDDAIVIDDGSVLFCAASDGGDSLRASAFSAEPLEGPETKPGS